MSPLNRLEPCSCGRLMSRAASRCPHCQKERTKVLPPRPPRLCKICHSPISGDQKLEYEMHDRCLIQQFRIPQGVQCPDCDVSLAGSAMEQRITEALHTVERTRPVHTCDNCGCPTAVIFEICYFCKGCIYSWQQSATATQLITDSEDGDTEVTHPCHMWCYLPYSI
jgi:hypothetical protein